MTAVLPAEEAGTRPALANRPGYEALPVLLGSLTLCRRCFGPVPRWAQRQHADWHARLGDPWPPVPVAAGFDLADYAAESRPIRDSTPATACVFCEAPLSRDGSCSRSCVGVGDG